MLNTTLKAFIWSLVLLVSTPVLSSSNEDGEKVDVNEMIMHHIKDAHEWHILTLEGEDGHEEHISVPLPIILIDGGLKVFLSSKLYHGEHIEFTNEKGEHEHYIASEELGYGIYHEKIYKLNEAGLLDFHDGHPTNVKPLDFSITKNVFALLFSAVLLFILLKAAVNTYKKDDIARENIGESKYKRFMPFLLTVFFFIWINNLLGLIPLFPGGANLTGNISFTLVLASFTLILTLISGNKHYWQHIFATPGVPKALLPIMIPVEFIGIFTKPFALMIRLFANITAGHIIILSLVGIIFTFQSAAWGFLSVPMALFINVLELLVAFLQAFIFTMLSALFIGAAVSEHH